MDIFEWFDFGDEVLLLNSGSGVSLCDTSLSSSRGCEIVKGVQGWVDFNVGVGCALSRNLVMRVYTDDLVAQRGVDVDGKNGQ